MSISLVASQNPKAVSTNLSISVSIRSNLSVIMEITKQRSVTEQIRNESIINLGLSTITFKWFGLVLWCLMSLSTIFQLDRGGQFYWWRKPEKTTVLSQVTEKLYHIMLYPVHLTWVGFDLTLVVIGTDCTDSLSPTTIRSRLKSNYHTITAKTAPI
jgi:hypothetical protein